MSNLGLKNVAKFITHNQIIGFKGMNIISFEECAQNITSLVCKCTEFFVKLFLHTAL